MTVAYAYAISSKTQKLSVQPNITSQSSIDETDCLKDLVPSSK
jgi:hypothetical protein